MIRTRETLVCATCGAHCVWHARKQALVCQSCGTDSIYQPNHAPATALAVDLAASLRDFRDESHDVAERRSIHCPTCNGVLVFDRATFGRSCDHCGAQIFDDASGHVAIRPHAVLPFRLDADQVREGFRQWLSEQAFTPGNFARRARITKLENRYVPYWTFDTFVRCLWQAEAGYDEQEEVEVRNARGEREWQTRTVTRWTPADGVLEDTFREEPVPGTSTVPREHLRKIEPFPTADALPYDRAFLAGHTVERCAIPLEAAAKQWYADMWTKLTALCAAQIPGDRYRDLTMQTYYERQVVKLVLVAVWLLTYEYRRKTYAVVVNDSTGAVAGEAPVSGWKLLGALLLIALLIAAVGLLAWFVTSLFVR